MYFDHPVHAPAEHTLNIDFLNPGQGPSARVAVELSAESARALAEAILATLASAPAGLVEPGSIPGPARPRARIVGVPCQYRTGGIPATPGPPGGTPS